VGVAASRLARHTVFDGKTLIAQIIAILADRLWGLEAPLMLPCLACVVEGNIRYRQPKTGW